ncbi:MAG: class I SAM-dependent methyltransferase [Spirochaetales bacterium]|nr:class I SAM-dependent methyltransferase [Spirochaetales bacterium]MCF7938653.1 class I SAM-dependent methyltransferase [Spirochaetales bacterium]
MSSKRHERLFEIIAFAYRWFFHGQVRYYRSVIEKNKDLLGVEPGDEVLDIGCGTGAFTYSLARCGFQATGIDVSGRMMRGPKAGTIRCLRGNIRDSLPFPDNSFDLVTAAYVAHGLNPSVRYQLYREASRISRGKVLLHDYNHRRRLITDIAEWLERGDYFNFIRVVRNELYEFFDHYQVVQVSRWNAWYICEP